MYSQLLLFCYDRRLDKDHRKPQKPWAGLLMRVAIFLGTVGYVGGLLLGLGGLLIEFGFWLRDGEFPGIKVGTVWRWLGLSDPVVAWVGAQKIIIGYSIGPSGGRFWA
jgi:hypothetical protein